MKNIFNKVRHNIKHYIEETDWDEQIIQTDEALKKIVLYLVFICFVGLGVLFIISR